MPVQQSVEILFSFRIAALLSLVPSPVPDGVVSHPVSYQFTVTGGTPPYTFTLAPGSSLPPGLTLSSNGLLSGTPTAEGAFSGSVIVTDAGT